MVQVRGRKPVAAEVDLLAAESWTSGFMRSTGDPRGGRAGPVVVTMHRAKDLEFRRGLLPDVSEAGREIGRASCRERV